MSRRLVLVAPPVLHAKTWWRGRSGTKAHLYSLAGFVRDLCDEGVFMFSGAIMARGSVAELVRDPQLTELYFGH